MIGAVGFIMRPAMQSKPARPEPTLGPRATFPRSGALGPSPRSLSPHPSGGPGLLAFLAPGGPDEGLGLSAAGSVMPG
jgi:hypothetical protein